MELVKFQRDQVIAHKHDKVNYWYLVQEGCVIQKFENSEIRLEKNSIIGILEKDMYLCDYIAGEDTVLASFVCNNATDLKNMLAGQEKIRGVFLTSAIKQRHRLYSLYTDLYNKARQFHGFVETVYSDYQNLCNKYKVQEGIFFKMTYFNPLDMHHKAETWEVQNSMSLVKNYLNEYLQLMSKDDAMTVGVIMEAAAQMHRVTQGIIEMEAYFSYNEDILFCETGNDLFQLYFDLSIQVFEKKYDINSIIEKMHYIVMFAEKLGIYNPRMLQRRRNELKNYDYVGAVNEGGISERIRQDIDITKEDSVGHILEYAGYQDAQIDSFSKLLSDYRNLPDMLSTDSEAYGMRKKIATEFYEIYYKVFMRAVRDESSLTPILEMFLNFGYMDLSYTGEKHAKDLYDLCAHVDICHSEHIYTIYEWLKCIYRGEKEPSKNEFDMSYAGYLADLNKNGKITKEQVKEYYENREKRVEFEIHNMFTSVNKTTYGKITTFCPVLNEYDLLTSVEKMLVTAERLEKALNEVRMVDYSAFYREVPFSDPENGINNDRVMKEILPDIILMPNAGTKVMMWQEISGQRSNTPGRFMFPIFTAVDVDELMLEAIGRFRWEMCRRMQGMRWNDIREKSLTAEYCTYIQFYRKNRDLSADAKDKIKSALTRAKNNYREVFVRDYMNWIKFESKGSYRLNKVARDILVQYCPFVRAVRNELKVNPMYQASITRFDAENSKQLQRYQGLLNRYIKAGGMQVTDLKDTILYYEM